MGGFIAWVRRWVDANREYKFMVLSCKLGIHLLPEVRGMAHVWDNQCWCVYRRTQFGHMRLPEWTGERE